MEKLFYEDAYLTEFQAEVISCEADGKGCYGIVLNRSAFYPEGGGQPFDVGVLGNVRVLGVHEKDGLVVHTTDGALEPGGAVRGIVDWDRRFRHMQNHSGEHILSGVIHRRFGYDNVGFHMGSDVVTIDFNGVISPEELAEAEHEANCIVFGDVPVLTAYPSAQELDVLDYRSKKELTGEVRIVTIPGGDVCACCGTHVKTTGAIGVIKTVGMIHYKGGVRISMLCGWDALADYGKRLRQVADISHMLSAKADGVTDAVAKLKEESAKKDLQINRLFWQVIAARTAAMPDRKEPLCLFEEDLNPVQLRQFCTMLFEQKKGNVVAVCSWNGSAYQFALGSSSVDVRALSRELNRSLDGRGGGSDKMVQGMWNAGEAKIREAVAGVG